MTVTIKALCPGAALGTGDTTLYTCPTGTTAIVTAGTFANTDVSARTADLRIVRSGASPDSFLFNDQAIAAKATYVSPEIVNLALAAGDYIVGSASAAAVVQAVISGFEKVG
jgi:hypothetical protein